MKKKLKKLMSLAAVLCMVLAVFNPVQTQAAAKLNVTKKTMEIGQTVKLRVTGTSKKVTWSSNKSSVASVNKNGKVTAKGEGAATITAKVAKKKLKCKITVKASFSASEATKKISCTLKDTGKGVVAILKNNNDITVSLDATLAYYSGGKMVGTASDENNGFESGNTCALFFSAPHDGDYNDISYDDYRITMQIEKGSSNLICGANGINVESDMGTGNVSAEVTNNSGKNLEFITLAVVFYDSSNNAIGYEDTYAKCETSGSVDFVSFDFPYDKNYDTITPSRYEIYVNYAYIYNWME